MKASPLQLFFLCLTTFTLLAFELPNDWFKAGSQPDCYDMGFEKGAGPQGNNAATIKSLNKKIKGFGTLMQTCMADKYRGKRIRMSAYLKSAEVQRWAGLWLRIDQKNSTKPLGFDNMHNRPIKGNSAWKKYELVLDVPENASRMAYGALLVGKGQIWFAQLQFEVVDTLVKTSGIPVKDGNYPNACLQEPSNLDFEN